MKVLSSSQMERGACSPGLLDIGQAKCMSWTARTGWTANTLRLLCSRLSLAFVLSSTRGMESLLAGPFGYWTG